MLKKQQLCICKCVWSVDGLAASPWLSSIYPLDDIGHCWSSYVSNEIKRSFESSSVFTPGQPSPGAQTAPTQQEDNKKEGIKGRNGGRESEREVVVNKETAERQNWLYLNAAWRFIKCCSISSCDALWYHLFLYFISQLGSVITSHLQTSTSTLKWAFRVLLYCTDNIQLVKLSKRYCNNNNWYLQRQQNVNVVHEPALTLWCGRMLLHTSLISFSRTWFDPVFKKFLPGVAEMLNIRCQFWWNSKRSFKILRIWVTAVGTRHRHNASSYRYHLGQMHGSHNSSPHASHASPDLALSQKHWGLI